MTVSSISTDLKWQQAHGGKAGAISCFRKVFELPADRKIRRAVLVLYAFNHCQAAINEIPIGDGAYWEKTARLDASGQVRPGKNLITLSATQTDPHAPAVIGKLVVQFEAGDDFVLPVDGTWKVAPTPSQDWEKLDFDDSAWANATEWGWFGSQSDLERVPAPYLRKAFHVEGEIRRAMVYATARGAYELHLNGKKVGNDLLTPGWPEFRKRVHYQAYDVTTQVRKGENALGAILGDGWFASNLAHLRQRKFYKDNPRLLVQLVVELEDGTTRVIASDPSWKATWGPIRHADLQFGCEYDSRLEMPGWDQPGFNDGGWQPVAVSSDELKGTAAGFRVQAAVGEASRVQNELPTIKVTEPQPGCWTFDLGQNMVGWVRLKVKGEKGQRITVRHAEMINPDGTIYTAALRGCQAADFYVLSGGEQVLEPYFTFHGFRYVEVRGLKEKPDPEMVTGIVVHSTMQRTGSFECSHPLLNQLYSNILWSQKGNFLEVPTDCPQRDERMGWTGDAQFFAPTAAYNFDVANFFARWLQTCEDNQASDGNMPWVVPDIMNQHGSMGWGDAGLLCVYHIYRAYGDTRIIEERYGMMERFMKWLSGRTQNGITKVGGFSDWLNLGGGAPNDVIDTAYHAYEAGLMAEMARAIGRNADAERYAALREELKAAFVREFVQPDGALKDSSQTGYALAFTMDMLPADLREKAAAKFVDEIARFNGHLATGFIGTPRLLPALSLAGRDDVAYQLLMKETYPSWLFQVKNGATTMWERWDAWTPDAGFGDVGMNSYNHYAFGAVGEYLYGGVGGIKPASPGYKSILIKPAIREGLTWAKTSFDSVYGRITSNWECEAGRLRMDVTIPANTTAEVHVPVKDGNTVTESGRPIADVTGVKFLRMQDGVPVYAVGSGSYRFESPLPGH
jgi:alpha-L-rhamnosidase